MVDFLDKLMSIAEKELGSDPVEEEVSPLAKLSKRELRKRFDENGDPRKGFDIDGNPVSSENNDSDELDPSVKAHKDRVSKRRSRLD